MRGRLVEAGWGAELGYPGLILDPSGQAIEVYIFESPELPNHWLRLDEFEGVGYRRVAHRIGLGQKPHHIVGTVVAVSEVLGIA